MNSRVTAKIDILVGKFAQVITMNRQVVRLPDFTIFEQLSALWKVTFMQLC